MLGLRILQAFDLASLVVALTVAKSTTDPKFRAVPTWGRSLLDLSLSLRAALTAVALFLTWFVLLRLHRLYGSRRLSRFRSDVRDLSLAMALSTLATVVVVWLMTGVLLSLGAMVIFLAVGLGALTISRALLRLGQYELRRHGRNLCHVVIVGTNRAAREYADRISARPEMGYVVTGFVDEALTDLPPGFRLVSDFERLPAFLRSHVVDEVVLFVPVKSFYERISQVVSLCVEQGITVRLRADLFDLTIGDLRVEETPVTQLPLATVRIGRMRGSHMALKRAIDVLGSATLLVVTCPVLICAAVAIAAGSSGPVFFVQERIGLNKRKFRLFKFRTMVPDAESLQADLDSRNEVDGPVFKIGNDPRITPVGRFLRRTSIDELPQLLNVLAGDMSLVGPRPLPVRDYAGFSEDAHRRRCSVRPGLTCLWQVSGRNSIPFERWMQMDMQYIDTWTIWLDFVILARTIPAVLFATGT
jgi:exopolysaccharide biosynthesis polyprenyl glycosylphosphotransferase